MFFNQKGIISMIRFGLPYLLSAISSLMSGQFRTETELKPLFSCNFKHVHCKPSVICIFQEQFLAFIFANLKAKKYEIGNQDA